MILTWESVLSRWNCENESLVSLKIWMSVISLGRYAGPPEEKPVPLGGNKELLLKYVSH